jgi:hypothetical protein
MSGVVNDHVEATVLGNDLLYGCVTRFLRRNVQFDGTQVDIVILGELFRLFDLWRITAPGLAHACIDSVAFAKARAVKAPNPLEAPVMMMIFFMLNFSFWFEFSDATKSRFEKGSGEAAIGTQHLRVYPAAVGSGEE